MRGGEVFLEAAGGISTAIDIYEKRNIFLRLLRRLSHKLINGTTRMGIFGSGGTGKTTLGNQLSGNLDTDKDIKPYIETISSQKFRSLGELPALITVVPGQEARRDVAWGALYREFAQGKSFRAVNVVSWGYHASGLEKVRHRAFKLGMSDEEFREAYFEDSRQEEIRALRAMVPHIASAKANFRMVTLVTKQDLWWEKRNEVLDYYNNSEYAEVISEITSKKGTAGFQHDLISCALIEQNLRMIDGFLLAQTTAGYDDVLRFLNLSAAMTAIEQMISD